MPERDRLRGELARNEEWTRGYLPQIRSMLNNINQLVGNLDDVWIPVSNYRVRPYVAAMAARPRLIPQVEEVAAVLEVPVRRLLAPDAVTEEEIDVSGFRLRAAVYRYAGERIWGATARTLAMFASVVRQASRVP